MKPYGAVKIKSTFYSHTVTRMKVKLEIKAKTTSTSHSDASSCSIRIGEQRVSLAGIVMVMINYVVTTTAYAFMD